jgi:DNA-binding NarL/FixJ family response regulator
MAKVGKIRILLVDDHAMVREGIRSWLCTAEHLCIVGEARDGREAIRMAKAHQPDVILLDLNMPRMNGFEAARALRKDVPKAALVAITVPSTRDQVRRLLALGAKGYVLKDAAPAELIRAIEAVAQGNLYFSSEAAHLLFSDSESKPGKKFDVAVATLTPREVEVLKLIADEFVTKEIATELHISARTVEAHRERLMRKLKIRTFAGLTRYAIATGITQI